MTKHDHNFGANVESLHGAGPTTFVTDELTRIAAIARSVSPADTDISFTFEKKLHIHLDIRSLEDVTRVEVMLPVRGGGLFSEFQRRPIHNTFFHRLSARVNR